MADILIRKVSEATKDILRRRAELKGRSLEADLRDTLERLARDEGVTPDETAPFGSWLMEISRPGAELDEALAAIRSAPIRPASFD